MSSAPIALPFVTGAALAALAGALIAPITATVPGMGLPYLIKSFFVVIVGGMGSMLGVVTGSTFIGGFENRLQRPVGRRVSAGIGAPARHLGGQTAARRPCTRMIKGAFLVRAQRYVMAPLQHPRARVLIFVALVALVAIYPTWEFLLRSHRSPRWAGAWHARRSASVFSGARPDYRVSDTPRSSGWAATRTASPLSISIRRSDLSSVS